MKKIIIKKYTNGELEENITIPSAFIKFLKLLLPSSALKELDRYGLSFEQILEASQNNTDYKSTIEVAEDGVMKQIVITIDS